MLRMYSFPLVRILLLLLFTGFLNRSLIAQTNTVPFQLLTVDGSPAVAPYNFHPSRLVPEINWTANWIWLDPAIYPNYQRTKTTWLGPDTKATPYRVFFRKEMNWQAGQSPVYLYCTADVRFRLYINGILTAEGPVNTGGDYDDTKAPEYWYYSVYDISKQLREGKNTIAVEVFSYALEWSEITGTYGGLLAEIKSGNQTLVRTDTSWLVVPDTSLQKKGDWLEWQTGTEPENWNAPAFTSSNWSKAALQRGLSKTRLFRSNIPDLLQASLKPLTPMPERFFSDSSYLLDFERNRVARIQCSFIASEGDTIEITPFEKKDYVASPSRAVRIIAKEGFNQFRSPNLAAFRYLRVRVASKKPVHFKAFDAVFTSYPLVYRGRFSCSDPFYTKLWSIARYTTQLCMGDMFYDSPMHQEPNACTGDYFIESLNAWYAFGDAWLTRQNLIQTAQMMEKNQYRMFHTSYSLVWVQMLHQYIQYTGDSSILTEVLPHAHQLMLLFRSYLNKDYLVANAPNYMFMDWIKIDRFNAHHPPAMIGTGYMTAFYYKALRDLAWLHEWGSKKSVATAYLSRASWYNQLADSIRNGIDLRLWDPGRKLYRDGVPGMTNVPPSFWLPADTSITTYSAHFNTLAVLYGIAQPNRMEALMRYVVTQQDYELQPYFMAYVLAAMSKLNKTDEGLELVDRWKNGIDTSTYTLKENWQDLSATGYRGDYSHAWGGSPLLFCSVNLLGITSYSPGYAQIAIRPYDGSTIEWASGAVPVGDNELVEVDWKKTAKTSKWEYRLPANRTAVLQLPESWRSKKIRINGKKVPYSSSLAYSFRQLLIEVE